MTSQSDGPELVINYSPKLDFCLALVAAQGHDNIALPDYRFRLACCLRHATGEFAYSGNDIYFELESFERFAAELQGLQQGLREEVALTDVGGMVVLRLQGNARALQATLDIREYLAPKMATLNAAFDVDYDLFVNKLRAEVDRFVGELRQVKLLPAEWTKF